MVTSTIKTTSSKGSKVWYTRTTTRSVSSGSMLLSSLGGARAVYKKGRGVLGNILGFIIIFLLFARLLNVQYQPQDYSKLYSFRTFLEILRSPPTDIIGASSFISDFRAFLYSFVNSDIAVIGPLISRFGSLLLFLLTPLQFILNGLNMLFNLFVWVFSFLVPWYII